MRTRWSIRCGLWGVVVLLASTLFAAPPAFASPPVETSPRLSCTFSVKYPVVLLRSGPGRSYAVEGFLRAGDTVKVIDQAAGDDGYVWWKGDNNTWVRSDLGSSDCPATCGNSVCEYGETASTCAKDCTASVHDLRSTGAGCKVESVQQCYESISCYPNCSDCRSWLNDYGCVTCTCNYPNSSGTSGSNTTTTGTGCVYASCDECIAAYPCYPGLCSDTECHLNEYGCPVCQTSQ